MNREIVKPLAAWDLDVGYTSILQPGTLASACRILRNHAPGAEPYVVEFDSAGHRYCCPLFTFQPRTQALTATAERKIDDCAPTAVALIGAATGVPSGSGAVSGFSTSVQL